MIACKITYNRKTRAYEVAITRIERICGVAPNTYYFDNVHSAIGVLVTCLTIGPNTVKEPQKRLALMQALIKYPGAQSGLPCRYPKAELSQNGAITVTAVCDFNLDV